MVGAKLRVLAVALTLGAGLVANGPAARALTSSEASTQIQSLVAAVPTGVVKGASIEEMIAAAQAQSDALMVLASEIKSLVINNTSSAGIVVAQIYTAGESAFYAGITRALARGLAEAIKDLQGKADTDAGANAALVAINTFLASDAFSRGGDFGLALEAELESAGVSLKPEVLRDPNSVEPVTNPLAVQVPVLPKNTASDVSPNWASVIVFYGIISTGSSGVVFGGDGGPDVIQGGGN